MQKNQNAIGVFDSGLGGLTVLRVLHEFLPHENFIYLADSNNAPYGNMSKAKIIERSRFITEFLIGKGAKLIVVACNTATSAAIDTLRAEYKLPFVGIEPAVKPASLLSKTGNIGVLATKSTLGGKLFLEKHETYGAYINIHYVEGAGLVELAENNKIQTDETSKVLEKLLKPMLREKVDQIVLGCTHYPLFKTKIQDIVGQEVNIIDPADAIAKRTKDLLIKNRNLNTAENPGIDFYSNGNHRIFKDMLKQVMPDLNNYSLSDF